jgi:hypothetical protein
VQPDDIVVRPPATFAEAMEARRRGHVSHRQPNHVTASSSVPSRPGTTGPAGEGLVGQCRVFLLAIVIWTRNSTTMYQGATCEEVSLAHFAREVDVQPSHPGSSPHIREFGFLFSKNQNRCRGFPYRISFLKKRCYMCRCSHR